MSDVRRVVVAGAGQRITGTVLPVLAARPDRFAVQAVLSRKARAVEAAGAVHHSVAFEQLSAEHLGDADLLYLCVAKGAVPSVLRRLVQLEPERRDLVIDTPVLLFKHLGALPLLARFRNVWVAEDCSTLPWIELARRAAGPVRQVRFERSAWRYHGLALARTLLADDRIRSARRQRAEGGDSVELRFAKGGRVRIVEPRDYAVGHTEIVGDSATVGDGDADASWLALRPQVEDGRLMGFSAGEHAAALDPVQRDLVGPVAVDASVTSLTERLKRVGLDRLLSDVHAGHGGYPLELGLDDMLVDYLLEKLGRWRPSPLTSLRGTVGRRLLPALMGVVGR